MYNIESVIEHYDAVRRILMKSEELSRVLSEEEIKSLKYIVDDVKCNLLITNNKGELIEEVVVGKMLLDLVNKTLDKNMIEFINHITSSHRTLQQSVFRLVKKLIFAWADTPDNYYDDRNKLTVLQSRHLVEFMKENKMGADMPCI